MDFKLVLLGALQGLTEFLPISSSGHLVLVQKIFSFSDMLLFDIAVHMASFLAIVIFFRKAILRITIRKIFLLFIATIPAGIAYVLFNGFIESLFSSTDWLWVSYLISAILIYLTKFSNSKTGIKTADGIIIGLFQALALLPGVSRSGATISGALMRGIKQEEAVEFSFLLGAIAIFMAFLVHLKDFVIQDVIFDTGVWIGFLSAFVFSLVSLKILIGFVKKSKFYLFFYYCLFMAFLILYLNFSMRLAKF